MVAEAALACLDSGEPRVIDIDLTDEVFGAGMPCGGTMRVYVEPVLPKPFAWLVGQGLILECLCDFAHRLGFDAVVTDSNASPEQFPRAYRVVRDDRRYLLLQPGRGDFVVVATHHKGDHAALARALNSEAAYVALVSSRKRAALVLQRLKREGFGDEVLARVRAPAGLDLGAKLPEEIALAIAAEMVLVRRGGKGQPMRELPRETATV
jgi:xanthine dehydrogenase accessory factor